VKIKNAKSAQLLLQQQFAREVLTAAMAESANVEVMRSVAQMKQSQFVIARHAPDVSPMDLLEMEVTKEHVPKRHKNVKLMENVPPRQSLVNKGILSQTR